VLKCAISNLLTYPIVNVISVVSVWMVYTNTNIRSPQKYLVVHNSGTEKPHEIFKTNGQHAEKIFIDHYQDERRRAEKEQIKLNIYLSFVPCGAQERNCARELRYFAKMYKFKLNIKVAAPYQKHEEELRELMTSALHCTVEAFTVKDYRDLARHLGFEMSRDWVPLQATIERDKQMRQKLQIIQEGENNV